MISGITPIHVTTPVEPLEMTPAKTSMTGSVAFSDMLTDAINSVENAQRSAAESVDGFFSGSGGELHSAILATQRADLQFSLFLQVRNKVMTAYQQIMQLQA